MREAPGEPRRKSRRRLSRSASGEIFGGGEIFEGVSTNADATLESGSRRELGSALLERMVWLWNVLELGMEGSTGPCAKVLR